MKYTKEQRLDIGRRIYDGEITKFEAAEEYGISDQTARNRKNTVNNKGKIEPPHLEKRGNL